MKLHHALTRPEGAPPLVVTIGFFDGLHCGHQELVRQTLRLRRPGFSAGVVTFANHPATFLRPGSEPALICTPQERIDLFAKAGLDECFFIPFDGALAQLSPEQFLDILIDRLGVRGVVVGASFRFGHKRAGDTTFMAQVLSRRNVACISVPPLEGEGERISSTRIRKAIEGGQTELADRLLGHSYELRGTVVTGAGRGHDLGFPTANIATPLKLLPNDGVYAATARYDGRDYAALVSIGTNPTFNGKSRTVEAWLRDFHETIYGEELSLRDLRFVREQQKFDSADALLAQMQNDTLAVPYPSFK
ncbi:MAG: bifunctional riboflavin kinase/FAD synthetase [Candidatus Eremiobacteraeota bacterium]|nr:bifunctional riboflavin kinase/FAD synthetase [Candidatus Eremiobacteraeota bacterium]